jgi:hypothetical protein
MINNTPVLSNIKSNNFHGLGQSVQFHKDQPLPPMLALRSYNPGGRRDKMLVALSGGLVMVTLGELHPP